MKSHGNYVESETILNELLDADPYFGPYWNQLAQSQFLRNDIQDSIISSEYSIAINPNDEEAVLNKANGLLHLVITMKRLSIMNVIRNYVIMQMLA